MLMKLMRIRNLEMDGSAKKNQKKKAMHRHQNLHEITTLTKYLLLDNFPLLLALNNETKHS